MALVPHWPLYLGPNKDLTNSVDKVNKVLNLLNNPQKKMNNVIHITGTNGKGSTANYIYNILKSHGFVVNLYTSPHIYECNERIVSNGKYILDNEMYYYFEKLRILCEKNDIDLTLFEATTLVAFMFFAETKADYNVIEVGMGGKNDATNVFDDSVLAVFTPIHVDHAKFLGHSPLQNAIEKAGIIKRNSTVVSAYQLPEVQTLLKSYGNDKYFLGSEYNIVKDDNTDKMLFSFDDKMMVLDLPLLIGDHQLINVGVAIMSVVALGINIMPEKVNSGIIGTKWPVRMEPVILSFLPKNIELFIDGAHNISGAFVVANFLKQKRDNGYKTYVINGRTKNTDSYNFLSQFVGIVEEVFAVTVKMEALPEAAEFIVEEGKRVGLVISKVGDIFEAIKMIINKHKYDNVSQKVSIVICGSLYLARDLKALVDSSK